MRSERGESDLLRLLLSARGQPIRLRMYIEGLCGGLIKIFGIQLDRVRGSWSQKSFRELLVCLSDR